MRTGTPLISQSVIRRPNEYRKLSLAERSVILKIHGAVDRTDSARDSYVVTEDHYIEYLSNTTLNRLVPVTILSKLLQTSFLFLGYGLKDWNLRAILHRMRKDRAEGWKWWAVQLESGELDRWVWTKHDLEILDARLEDYVGAVEACLATSASALPRP